MVQGLSFPCWEETRVSLVLLNPSTVCPATYITVEVIIEVTEGYTLACLCACTLLAVALPRYHPSLCRAHRAPFAVALAHMLTGS